MTTFGEHEGRTLFGHNPIGYATIRPPYPDALYDFLQTTGALRPQVATLELGAGSGLATRELLARGAAPLTVIEPDPRFAPLLHPLGQTYPGTLQVLGTSFEAAPVPPHSVDLVAAATSFHWVQPAVRVAKAARVLRPGGHLAIWWNVFGDPAVDDAFHEATKHILEPLETSPAERHIRRPFGLDTAARRAEILDSGAFADVQYAAFRWALPLSSAQVGALFATFSNISRLPTAQRTTILTRLIAVADNEFGGHIVKQMVSPIYVARRMS